MSLRKTRLVPAEPKVGRYRLFDWLPGGKRRCRICGGKSIRAGNVWTHFDRVHGWDDPDDEEDRMAFILRARRSRKNRKHGQYQFATKGEPWRPR
jgi:hypothetical protein